MKGLMIGNLLKNAVGEVIKVTPYTLLDIQDKSAIYSSIELTEEWFLKFGFKRTRLFWVKGDFEVAQINVGGFILHGEHGEMIGKIFKYVDQLQNLYYSIEQEELTLQK